MTRFDLVGLAMVAFAVFSVVAFVIAAQQPQILHNLGSPCAPDVVSVKCWTNDP